MSMQDSLTQRRTSGRTRREQALNQLLSEIEEEFDAVVSAQVDDATPGTWESASLFIQVESTPETYYEGVHKRTGYEIPENLRSLAPRLYNHIRDDERIATMQVLDRPNAITEDHRDNLYNRDHYFLDVRLY